jgi:hypothetical protein
MELFFELLESDLLGFFVGEVEKPKIIKLLIFFLENIRISGNFCFQLCFDKRPACHLIFVSYDSLCYVELCFSLVSWTLVHLYERKE